jgi:hypothetical protein
MVETKATQAVILMNDAALPLAPGLVAPGLDA